MAGDLDITLCTRACVGACHIGVNGPVFQVKLDNEPFCYMQVPGGACGQKGDESKFLGGCHALLVQ